MASYWMPSGWISNEPCPIKSSQSRDLTGEKRGALTVIGYAGDGCWLMRCVCGLYTLRRTRTIARKNMDDMCPSCTKEGAVFKRTFFHQHGRYPEYFELPEEPGR